MIRSEDLDDLLDKPAAAALLHRSVKTLNRLIAAQDIEVVRIGSGRGQVYLTRRAVLDYLNRQRQPARPRKTAAS